MIGAGLSGYLGWMFGMPAIFYLGAVFGLEKDEDGDGKFDSMCSVASRW